MTKEQQRIAIAEWMGLSRKSVGHFGHTNSERFAWFEGDRFRYNDEQLPNYPEDLNAMNEAEMKLTDNQKDSYAIKLFYVIFPRGGYELDCTTHFHTIHATASQRSEALCRTLWPERWTAMKGEV